MKTIILKCFCKNVNMLLKKKRSLSLFWWFRWRKFWWRKLNIRKFQTFLVPSWNIRNVLSLGLKSSIFQNIRKFCLFPQANFLFFKLWLKSAVFHFCKYKKCFLRKYKKSFSWENIRICFNIRARKFHFWKCKEFFWIFWVWTGKCAR